MYFFINLQLKSDKRYNIFLQTHRKINYTTVILANLPYILYSNFFKFILEAPIENMKEAHRKR